MRRFIQRHIGDELAIALLEGRYDDGAMVTVDVKDDQVLSVVIRAETLHLRAALPIYSR